MKTVKEVSALSGVSVRTLHHYDSIGLLRPTKITAAGYRLYDDAALRRLQTILLLRELEFPLQQIRELLDTPGFDQTQAIRQQIHLLELRRKHLDELIAHARKIEETGVISLDFSPFDTTELDAYAAEAREKWGSSAAYREYSQKTPNRSKAQSDAAEMMGIFARFGAIRTEAPDSPAAQALVRELQDFITAHYYTCTKELLSGLGKMYTADDRFRQNIDRSGGEGTAAFAEKAIQVYCS